MKFPFDDILKTLVGTDVHILSIQPMGGGSINEVQRVMSNKGAFVFKLNSEETFPGMFEKEKAGLELLRESQTLRIPKVIATGVHARQQYLILEYIPHGSRPAEFWQTFGRQLAAMHRHHTSGYGLEYDNYIGSLPQHNGSRTNGVSFFIEQRLHPMIQLAYDKKRLSTDHLKQFEKLAIKLPDLLPEAPASLLHGDLWSGNFISDKQNQPVLLDPAVYFGNREAELAFTLLFGGFDDLFYEAYEELYPTEPGFRERADLYNLYPLLVHLNLFGEAYLFDVKNILDLRS